MQVDRSDLLKIRDCLVREAAYHEYRDQMNAELHMAREVRYSPLTSEVLSTLDRVNKMLEVEP